jgi:hypothetical protein
MDFISDLSDNQFALLGCVVALTVSGLIMSLSGLMGQTRRERSHKTPSRPAADVSTTTACSTQRDAEPTASREAA